MIRSSRHRQSSSILNEVSSLKLSIKLVGTRSLVFGRVHQGSTVEFLLLQRFNVGLAVEYSSFFISVLNLDLYFCCFDASMLRGPNSLYVYEPQQNLAPTHPAIYSNSLNSNYY